MNNKLNFSITTRDGNFTLVFDANGGLTCHRNKYGDQYDLTGNRLVLGMAMELEDIRKENKELKEMLDERRDGGYKSDE